MFVVMLVLIVFVVLAAWSARALPALAGGDVTFPTAFVHFLVMLGTFNLLDLVALDFPLVYWQPRLVVLPGTEGMAGYSDYWFSFRGFLIGIPIVVSASAPIAAIVSSVI